jgi:MFS transporter, ACS family, glucarate transporter
MKAPSSSPYVADAVARPGDAQPTRARHITMAFAILLAIIMYIDRVCISQAAPFIRRDLALNAVQMGWVFSIFGWAYALFEVPGGWLGDRIGPRRVLMRIVIWWSFFTAATGWVWNLPSLLATRALFGIGEAGCFPNLTRVFTTWLPAKERERAQALLWLATRWGGAFTPLLVAYVLKFVSWRRAFEIFGVLGVIWAIAFYRWYRDNPATHPGVNSAELALLPPPADTASVRGPTPWRTILSTPSVWLLCAQYACLGYAWWFYVTWLPTYLRDARGMSTMQGALLSGLPLFFGGIGCLVSAALAVPLRRRTGSVAKARRVVAITGFLAASACTLIFTRIGDPTSAMIMLGMAGFFNDFAMPPAWAGAMDIGGRYSGTVSGAMNMMGNLGGVVSPLVLGSIVKHTGNWDLTFYLTGGLYFVGATCWLFINSTKPLPQDEVH